MPKYKVRVTTNVVRDYHGEVEADSQEEADAEAMDAYIDWDYDDVNEDYHSIDVTEED